MKLCQFSSLYVQNNSNGFQLQRELEDKGLEDKALGQGSVDLSLWLGPETPETWLRAPVLISTTCPL